MAKRDITTFHFEGLVELQAGLRELSEEAGNSRTGKAAMRRAALKALEPFVHVWQSIVPVLTGRYRERIVTGTRLTRRQATLARQGGKADLEVYAGTDDPAAQMQEFGTAYQPAQPSAGPAWEQTKDRVLTDFGALAWEQIRKAAERIRRKRAKSGRA